MNCQHCLAKEANFHYRSNINGEIREQHLCADCAQAAQNGLFAGALAGPLESLFGGRPGFAPLRRNTETAGRPVYVPYRTAEPVGDAHPGVPLEADVTLKQRRERNCLHQELQKAVETENFERAAELRDEIHHLEQGA